MEEFKLIVAGGRDFDNTELLVDTLNELAHTVFSDKGVSIVTGMARGADAMGSWFASRYNVKQYQFPADWEKYGKQAGFLRNMEMGNFADGVVAFWDGQSRGTKHMVEYMKKQNKYVHVVMY